MCAIFGSSDKEKFVELAEANQYRGNESWSVAQFKTGAFKHYRDAESFKLVDLFQGGGQFIPDIMDEFKEQELLLNNFYYLGHVQAPTTSSVSVHPSNYDNDLLWHNGIIKDYQVKEWQIEYGNKEWDTELLHRHILLGGSLDNVDGTFSCARYDKKDIYLFRNEISPLFYDNKLNISSIKFENAEETEAGVMYKIKLHSNELEAMYRFETKENPYYFG
tara:strand:+ start:145 stop:801 length:657 start_codon:yes stop_codon:yes gene_type:complete